VVSDELTDLQQDELRAAVGDRMAVLRVVSALRLYRAASRRLLDARWGDGAADGYHTSVFADAVTEIEQAE